LCYYSKAQLIRFWATNLILLECAREENNKFTIEEMRNEWNKNQMKIQTKANKSKQPKKKNVKKKRKMGANRGLNPGPLATKLRV